VRRKAIHSDNQKLLSFHTSGLVEAGCDEAGRGCLAGPVVAAAVILPEQFYHPLLNDSKQMTEADRMQLREIIKKASRAWAIGFVSPAEIDDINILNASFLAMHRAIDQLRKRPKHLLIDGNRFNTYRTTKHTCVVQGDGIYASIAAASVLAKTERDIYMARLSAEYPQYGWEQNKGYPTPYHRAALLEHGWCEHHRKSFKLLPELTLFDGVEID
jgi:ribonuclease HII